MKNCPIKLYLSFKLVHIFPFMTITQVKKILKNQTKSFSHIKKIGQLEFFWVTCILMGKL